MARGTLHPIRRILSFLAATLLLSGCALVQVSLFPPEAPPVEKTIEGKGREKILLLDVTGFISSREKSAGFGQKTPALTTQFRESLRKAADDPDVAGLILRLDSPGGTVTASDIVYHELKRFREKRNIPVYAVIVNVGTSGAYYIASAADRIVAHPTSVTGSIGVISVQLNLQGLMEKVGVEGKVVKSAPLKDIYSPFRPDTPEEQEILSGIIGELHDRFVDVVAKGRSGQLSKDQIATLADGRPYSAPQALEAGLIDATGYLDDVIEEMKQVLNLSEARIITYDVPSARPRSIYDSTGAVMPEGTRINLLNVDLGALADPPETTFLYLWSP